MTKQALFIVHEVHQGNTMRDSDVESISEDILTTTNIFDIKTFCDKIIDILKDFQDSKNFDDEIAKIPAMLNKNNFAQLLFQYPSSKYYVTIVSPKFD